MEINKKTLDDLAKDYTSRLSLPARRADSLFVIATIGLVGSGRTIVAKKIADRINGAILIQANSARFLLKKIGLPWGENVRQILKQVSKDLLAQGYGIVFDGNASDNEDRKNINEISQDADARTFYVRIIIDPEVAKQREREKYNDTNWISSFEDFRVNTTEKMLKNIDDRAELHRNLMSNEIPDFAGEINNNGTPESLNEQIDRVVENIQKLLR